MKLYMAAGGALLLAAVVGIAVTAGDAKSGLQPGDGCGVFEPLNVTGPFAGQKRCLV